MTAREKKLVDNFVQCWLESQGYQPAGFQKAIALQRFRRGETVWQIIAALMKQRV